MRNYHTTLGILLFFCFHTAIAQSSLKPSFNSIKTYSLEMFPFETSNGNKIEARQVFVRLNSYIRIPENGDLILQIRFKNELELNQINRKDYETKEGSFYEISYRTPSYAAILRDRRRNVLWEKYYAQEEQSNIFEEKGLISQSALSEAWEQKKANYYKDLELTSLSFAQLEIDLNEFLVKRNEAITLKQKTQPEILTKNSIDSYATTEIDESENSIAEIDEESNTIDENNIPVSSTVIQIDEPILDNSEEEKITTFPEEENNLTIVPPTNETNLDINIEEEVLTDKTDVKTEIAINSGFELEEAEVAEETIIDPANTNINININETQEEDVTENTTIPTATDVDYQIDQSKEDSSNDIPSEPEYDYDEYEDNSGNIDDAPDPEDVEIDYEDEGETPPLTKLVQEVYKTGIYVGGGRMPLNVSPGTITTSIVDDSPSMDQFSSRVTTSEEEYMYFVRLGFVGENYTKHRFWGLNFDIGLGNQGNVNKFEFEYNYGWLIGKGWLRLSPQFGLVAGNSDVSLGKMFQNEIYIQIGDDEEDRFYSNSVDVSYQNLYAGVTGRMNMNISLGKRLDLNFYGGYTKGFGLFERVKFSGTDIEDLSMTKYRKLPNNRTALSIDTDRVGDKLFGFSGIKLGAGVIFNLKNISSREAEETQIEGQRN